MEKIAKDIINVGIGAVESIKKIVDENTSNLQNSFQELAAKGAADQSDSATQLRENLDKAIANIDDLRTKVDGFVTEQQTKLNEALVKVPLKRAGHPERPDAHPRRRFRRSVHHGAECPDAADAKAADLAEEGAERQQLPQNREEEVAVVGGGHGCGGGRFAGAGAVFVIFVSVTTDGTAALLRHSSTLSANLLVHRLVDQEDAKGHHRHHCDDRGRPGHGRVGA